MGKVIVLTLSTDPNTTNENCFQSLRYHGYEHYVLGRGQRFMGWPMRTRLYIEGTKNFATDANDIVVLVDSDDLYFVGPPAELETKFLKTGKRVIIGAEPACCNGKYGYDRVGRERITKILRERIGNRYAFVNGGALIGFRDPLLALLESNKNEPDDQGGYLQKILDDPNRFELDSQQDIIGNVPLLHSYYRVTGDPEVPELDYWRVENKRAVNTLTGKSPVILHFSGKHWDAYNHLAKQIYPTTQDKGAPTVRFNLTSAITRTMLVDPVTKAENQEGGLFSQDVKWDNKMLVPIVLSICGAAVLVGVVYIGRMDVKKHKQ